MTDLTHFMVTIGYNFNNASLLELALTHSSYGNEVFHDKYHSNERLEFLGDAVLEVTVSDYLYNRYPDKSEGELSKIRASLVCEPTLALCAKDIDLGNSLYMGKGEELTGGRFRDSIVSDAFEAVIGAIYLDGGIEPARDFIGRFILRDIDSKKLFVDSKTILQERFQSVGLGDVKYVLTGEEGPDHNKIYTSQVVANGKVYGEGSGSSKKASEQHAAYDAIMKMNGR